MLPILGSKVSQNGKMVFNNYYIDFNRISRASDNQQNVTSKLHNYRTSKRHQNKFKPNQHFLRTLRILPLYAFVANIKEVLQPQHQL